MKLFHNTHRQIIVLLILSICCFSTATTAVAATSSVFNEITVESSSGNDHTTSHIDVTNITTSNGESTSYHFATSSTGTIEHHVVLEQYADNNPLLHASTSSVSIVSNFDHLISAAGTVTTPTDFIGWLQLLRNFLTLYVETSL